jgi:small subunit ribosomal protein S1
MNDDIKPLEGDPQFRPQNELDVDLEKEISDALGDASLEQLIGNSAPAGGGDGEINLIARKVTSSGQKLYHSVVTAIHGDDLFVDLGGKMQGLLTTGQFSEDDPLPEVGDEVEFTITGRTTSDGLAILARSGAVETASWDSLEKGQVVAGTVTGHNKGGLELKINGLRAFMPLSQIERHSQVDSEDLSSYHNQKMTAVVVECNSRDKKFVVSHRQYVEAEAKKNRANLLENLQEGDTVTGTVRSIMPYGAFVDLGGLDGLLHVREMAYARVNDPNEIVSIGQELSVKILKIDREEEKLSLSLKAATSDPWLAVGTNYHEGDLVTGKITRLMDFGAFLELEPGLEGLIPISELSFTKRVNHPKEVVAEGQEVSVRVLSVDPSRQRVSLSLKQVGDNPWVGAAVRWPVGSKVEGLVMRTADFGAFVQLTKGVEGLIHISELSDKHVSRVGEVVREGDTVEVKILDVDEDNRRISLSMKEESSGTGFTGKADGYVSRAADAPEPMGLLNMGGVPDGGKGQRAKNKKKRKGGL